MKSQPFFRCGKLGTLKLCLVFISLIAGQIANAQCPAGYTSATINWDNLEYLHNKSSYYTGTNPATSLPYVSTSMWQNQSFAIGTNRCTISTTIGAGGSGSTWGDVTTHTGETGAYGTGADLAFVKSGTAASTITLTFDAEVKNLQFS